MVESRVLPVPVFCRQLLYSVIIRCNKSDDRVFSNDVSILYGGGKEHRCLSVFPDGGFYLFTVFTGIAGTVNGRNPVAVGVVCKDVRIIKVYAFHPVLNDMVFFRSAFCPLDSVAQRVRAYRHVA